MAFSHPHKKSVPDYLPETDLRFYSEAPIERCFPYSYCAYLRWNTHRHCSAVHNYYSVANVEVTVAASVHSNLLTSSAVTDKKSVIIYFKYSCTHCSHSITPDNICTIYIICYHKSSFRLPAKSYIVIHSVSAIFSEISAKHSRYSSILSESALYCSRSGIKRYQSVP